MGEIAAIEYCPAFENLRFLLRMDRNRVAWAVPNLIF
jgi:hypothetical protein